MKFTNLEFANIEPTNREPFRVTTIKSKTQFETKEHLFFPVIYKEIMNYFWNTRGKRPSDVFYFPKSKTFFIGTKVGDLRIVDSERILLEAFDTYEVNFFDKQVEPFRFFIVLLYVPDYILPKKQYFFACTTMDPFSEFINNIINYIKTEFNIVVDREKIENLFTL